MGEKVGGMLVEDLGEGMQCSDHPYRSNPGGICAFCLQEKLGKLVSSSKSSNPFFSATPLPCSSSSSPPPTLPSSELPTSASLATAASSSGGRISFLSAKHRRSKKKSTGVVPKVAETSSSSAIAVLNRSKSVAQRPINATALAEAADSPRKKSFWSYFTLPSVSTSSAATSSVVVKRRSTSSADLAKQQVEDDDEASAVSAITDGSPSGSQASSSFGRKVARSRSVGCGSRSFSGDFLERISNGFGDCTLRRAESQRETKPKIPARRRGRHGDPDDAQQQIKERVKCGGIFGGLGMFYSPAYWLPAAATTASTGDEEDLVDLSRLPATRRSAASHSRSKSWAWAFASPIRAFRPIGSGGEQTAIVSGAGSRGCRNGGANPSMLAVGS
ncbi:hypothetical protein AXF42_Ash006742 [Apostasia shenzhenica]|uniref:Uncharacterized protein n=1 Tax=Apostasia shenzhenica TaxID=1088818 RepID=A0A2I0AJ23_9ASPA|nr:hypothetical protein AXF42_Ash006742 [Apostasia shenzhenica]